MTPTPTSQDSRTTPNRPMPTRTTLGVSSLSQFVRMHNCERFLRFRLVTDDDHRLRARYGINIQALTPLLQDEGSLFEQQVYANLAAGGMQVVDLTDRKPAATSDWLRQVTQPLLLQQAPVIAPLGNYAIVGEADLIHLRRDARGQLHILIGDIKASRVERMEHRLQVAAYAHAVQSMAAEAGLAVASISGAILHMQEDGALPTLDATPPFDLDPYLTTLRHLMTDADAIANRVAAADFDEIAFHFGVHCDGCMYNGLCMAYAADHQDLALVPQINASEKRTLRAHGIKTLRQLAELMEYAPDGTWEMTPNPAYLAIYRALSNVWPIATNLPVLVQRARRALKRFDPTVAAKTTLISNGYGTLPTDDEHPGLIKLFIDAQHDYLRDRLYLLSGLVSGPNGQRVIVKRTLHPPDDEDEARLLVSWLHALLAAVPPVSDRTHAPIHLYCYDPRDQRVLLEALKRHLGEIALIPGFFDLLTQSPALSQPVISFLHQELSERRNLGVVCGPLHDAARMLGFSWSDGDEHYHKLFRTRLFDNNRSFLRVEDGSLRPLADADRDPGAGSASDGTISDPRRVSIESAARFNSQIPLEYVYAIWGELPDDPAYARTLAPFRQVSAAQLEGFAAQRVRALAHIEASFRNKARYLEKAPFDLTRLAQPDGIPVTLAQSLREFLYMEHHAALQAKLQIYGLPVPRRVQTGLALLLRYDRHDVDAGVHRFALTYDELALDPALTLNGLRLKEGAWVVINRADDTRLSANRIKHGRLAVIESVDATGSNSGIALKLLDLNFGKGSKFRYFHAKVDPVAGDYYLLDEMADDLNGDKLLEALGQTEQNTLYRWLLQPPPRRPVAAMTQQRNAELHQYLATLNRPQRMTKTQSAVVAQHLDDPLLLVQGPPGTGKSHTIGWAVIQRLLLAAAEGRPLRVAVTCKTHNAVNIVLESIAKKWRRLQGFTPPSLAQQGLPALDCYKISSDEGGAMAVGVSALAPYTTGHSDLNHILDQPYVVIGGTPGGLYTLAKYCCPEKKKRVDWTRHSFDLLIIDEASQMSVPEAVLAGAFLKPEGHAIVVGDHRQMPPIVAHDWEREEKRSVAAAQPHLSLFETLLQLGFARESLDESFRLHASMAQFLQENIYVQDGIHFFSKRKELLLRPPPVDAFVDRVMAPEYPIVVIEHGENASQQYNLTELALVTPLVQAALTMRLDGADGIGVVVPHRAQKALLRQTFPELANSNAIDTVERFQGGERDVIIVSATASDPDYVLAEADFLLNLNRLNVAFSRPRKKLIVVASSSVTKLLVSDLETFANAIIWKRLYYQYATEILWQGQREGVSVTVRGYLAR